LLWKGEAALAGLLADRGDRAAGLSNDIGKLLRGYFKTPPYHLDLHMVAHVEAAAEGALLPSVIHALDS
jgi:hypothetical protein